MIAPSRVLFFTCDWLCLGQKRGRLLDTICKITGVHKDVLTPAEEGSALYEIYETAIRVRLSEFSVASRMSWAAHRETTRREDEAYSLLGIFGINMSMLYGEEGGAFYRLQHEIMRSSHDQSIFAWELPQNDPSPHQKMDILASSARVFAGCEDVTLCSPRDPMGYEMTKEGLHITMPLLPFEEGVRLWWPNGRQIEKVQPSADSRLGLLNCQKYGSVLAIGLKIPGSTERIVGKGPASQKIKERETISFLADRSATTRIVPVGTDTALKAEQQAIVICAYARQFVGRLPLQNRFSIWLHLANDPACNKLRLESAWTPDDWEVLLSNTGDFILHDEGNIARIPLISERTPKWLRRGIITAAVFLREPNKRKGVAVCFTYSSDLSLPSAGLELIHTAEPDLEAYCTALKDRTTRDMRAHERTALEQSLQTDDAQKITVRMNYGAEYDLLNKTMVIEVMSSSSTVVHPSSIEHESE